MFNFLSSVNSLEFFAVANVILWIITALLWGIDRLMKKPAYKIAWADCGQIVCFIDAVILVFSILFYGIVVTLGMYIPDVMLLLIFIFVLVAAFMGGVIWKFLDK
ncbi:hypothetical protein M3M35_01465 [Fructilactobacillus myrtifloralis]|uniref:Uncharacterized protein n=1 Tax=Fructilactobacillus myrtifloralis TaxID=2940301 RepID=A0ABY5BQ23_9LACO|nr:hypothetical protein [Fructilactobacillus myrtifloralis]USS85360.1 hypothetical protein M3M35_01465 [Fructilactobacillus myrtifloralis]